MNRRVFLTALAAFTTCGAAPSGTGPPGAAPSGASPAPLPGVRSRADWRALPPRAGGRPHVAARLALHHTAGALVGTDRAAATLRGVQTFHQRDKGWVDLAYHLFIDADGVAWEGRDPGLAGDTATAYDPAGFYLVCALGNFEEVAPPPALREGIARLLATLHRERGLPLDTLALHRDLADGTLCPGRHLADHAPGILARARELAAG
jgi:hypothetical protein